MEEAEQVAAAAVGKVKVGDPFAEGTHLGPLASAAQRDRVQGYIQKGIDEGATVVAGGLGAPEGLDTGYYVRPTVFSGVKPDMTIAQEEIFGPVLSILPYRDEDDAVEIANGVVYGLAGGVWSADKDRAVGVARRLRTGQVEVNGGAFNPNAPFGGYKQSGVGREYGTPRLRGVPGGEESPALTTSRDCSGSTVARQWSSGRGAASVPLPPPASPPSVRPSRAPTPTSKSAVTDGDAASVPAPRRCTSTCSTPASMQRLATTSARPTCS